MIQSLDSSIIRISARAYVVSLVTESLITLTFVKKDLSCNKVLSREPRNAVGKTLETTSHALRGRQIHDNVHVEREAERVGQATQH